MDALAAFLHARSRKGCIPLSIEKEASDRFHCALALVEEEILGLGLMPERYLRNRQTITTENQLRLLQSHAAVIGCGGIGGYVIEELARIGIGTITLIDPDSFEEHNLNRQFLATLESLREPKVASAERRIAAINPAVTVRAHRCALSRENGPDLMAGARVAVDGLDSVSARRILSDVCEGLNIPLVHGSAAGWYGQVTTQFPGDRTLQRMFSGYASEKGIEETLGNPCILPPLVASLEAAETVKVLLGEGTLLRGRLLSVNLLDMEFAVIPIKD